jgi:hypothetical protein
LGGASTPPLAFLLGGWRTNGIFTAMAGLPRRRARHGRPDGIPASDAGAPGQFRANSLREPGLVNLDFGLFRGEAFNFTNTPHWALPSANVSSATFRADGAISNLGGFGSITATGGNYLTQLGTDERTSGWGCSSHSETDRTT